MSSTAVFGAVFVDIKGYPVGRYVADGRNIGSIQYIHGGVSRNVAENLAHLGEEVSFISSVDPTAMGRDVVSYLKNCGVDVENIVESPASMGTWLALFNENGDLAGSISQQPDFSALEKLIREHGDEIVQNCGRLVLEIDTREEIAEHLLDLARQYNKKAYTIVGNMGVILRRPDLLRCLDCFICNEIEAGRLFGCDLSALSPDEMLSFLPDAMNRAQLSAMIVTMGAAGSVYFDARTNERGICPVVPCTVVDTTGAGDAYFSGVVAALARGRSLKEAAGIGAELASVVIGRTQNACPPLQDFFRQHK